MTELYIGLMSGTSMDAIDAVLVNFDECQQQSIALVDTLSYPLSADIRSLLNELCIPGHNEIQRLGQADVMLGRLFAKTVLSLLKKSKTLAKNVLAIGCHGQTIRHCPQGDYPFTLQIGDPNIIAQETSITTIADFRRRDMACGGQGAPLVPGFHQAIFKHPEHNRIILNIGGIANITLLNHEQLIGFDTGPGNTLMDAWIQKHLQKSYDENGQWALQGQVDQPLLARLLNDSYFTKAPPKSTGKEYFNLHWLEQHLQRTNKETPPENVQATLLELTAQSIITAIQRFHPSSAQIIGCGGGVYNQALLKRLDELKGSYSLHTSQEFNINPKWIEAIAFAYLAKQTLNAAPGNIPSVTGSKCYAVLGGIYL